MRKNGLYLAGLVVLLTACGGPLYVTQETFDSRLAELQTQSEDLESRIDSVRACEEWRTTYVREGTNCINGLNQPTLVALAWENEGNLTEELIYERRVGACMFACSFEQQCEHERQEVCEFVEAHRESESSDETPESSDTEEETLE